MACLCSDSNHIGLEIYSNQCGAQPHGGSVLKNNQCRIVALILGCLVLGGLAFAKTNTSTTLSSSANPSTYGSSVTFTATVTPLAATGTVTFKDGSTTLGTGTLSSGKATYSTSKLTAGSHSITASYGGDTNYNSSTSSALTQTVNKANSTVTLSSSANPSTYGSSVKFTTTVTPSSCTGTVTFKDSSTTLGTGTLSSGKATFSTSTLTAGSHSITGSYGGDSNCNSSTSSALTQTVNKANTTTTLSSSSNPSAYASSVTFTATVSSTTATGTVTFKDGTTTLGTGNVSSGKATYNTSTLAIGSHSITGVYSGDTNYNTSTSSKLTQTVKQTSAATVSSSTNPAPFSAPVTFTAVVSPTAATGTVMFMDSATTLGTGTLSGGTASFSTSSLAVGSHSITAAYGGDSNYVGSKSPILTQSVLTLTSIALTPQNASVPVGATQQFTATGTFSDGTNGNITASATWTSSATTVATVSSAGVATLLDEGPTTIQAAVGSVNGSTSLTGTPSRFRFTGSLVNARDTFTATTLQNGKVLIAGGLGPRASLIAQCELYDPTTGTFTKTGNLFTPRFNHTATLLNNGMVLIAGGEVSDGSGAFTESASAELYDPNSGTLSPAGSLNQARKNHTATLLGSGLVLIAGGNGLSGDPVAAELYNSSTNSFSNAANLKTARDAQTATLLNDGTVLIAGGETYPGGTVLSSAELYNPTTGVFTTTGSLNVGSSNHSATLLNSGKVLIASGTGLSVPLARTELYDPLTKSFTLSASLTTPRWLFTATLLSNGQVLFVGGVGTTQVIGTGELYDPTSGTTSIAGNLNIPRGYHAAAPLNNGMVLFAGGIDKGSLDLSSAETYQSTTTEPPPLSLQITPAVVHMVIGGTQHFNAIDNHGSPRLDVAWTVSDPSLVSLTTDEDNAAILTGVAPGQVTLTASAEGVTAQEQVTVLSQSSFTTGTTIWSSPPPFPGFSVTQLAQAVPSASGPDLYSISQSADGTQSIIQALQADGEQLWQASMPPLIGNSVPDSSGGLIVTTCASGSPMTVVDLDATGQPLWQQPAAGVDTGHGFQYLCYPAPIAVRADGRTYITEPTNAGLPSLTVAYPNGYIQGSQFPPSTVTLNGRTTQVQCCMGPPMANTDDTVYFEYEVRTTNNNVITSDALYLYNATTGSAIVLSSTTQDEALLPGPIIPDGQAGILATWTISPSHSVLQYPYQAADVTNGVLGTPYNLPFSPQSVTPFQSPTLALGQTGTAFARGSTTVTINGALTSVDQIASFNVSSGGTNWTYQAGAGSTFSILGVLSDGSVAVNDSLNGIVLLSPSGGATPVSGPVAGVPQYSWSGDWYLQGSQATSGLMLPLDIDAANVWASPVGNPSGQASTDSLCECELQTTSQQAPSTADNMPSGLPPTISSCPIICSLPSPVYPATSCTTIAGSGPTYLILIGDPGLPPHNVNYGFALAAQQNANDLQAQGNKVIACRISTAKDFNQALTTNGSIGGGIIYFGHSGPYLFSSSPRVILSILAIGQAAGGDTNLSYNNINEICPTGCSSILGSNITLVINGCRAGKSVPGDPSDATGISATPIAKVLARQLSIRVTAYMVGTYFSLNNAANATSTDWRGEPNPLPTSTPMYLIPEGAPAKKKAPTPFCAVGNCPN
jgi:hypothetical protein